jgi:hypothetical protein
MSFKSEPVLPLLILSGLLLLGVLVGLTAEQLYRSSDPPLAQLQSAASSDEVHAPPPEPLRGEPRPSADAAKRRPPAPEWQIPAWVVKPPAPDPRTPLPPAPVEPPSPIAHRPPMHNPGGVNGDRGARPVPGIDDHEN